MNSKELQKKYKDLQAAWAKGAQIVLGDYTEDTIGLKDFLISKGHSYVPNLSNLNPNRPVVFISLPFRDAEHICNADPRSYRRISQFRRARLKALLEKKLCSSLVFVGDVNDKTAKEYAKKYGNEVFHFGKRGKYDRILARCSSSKEQWSIALFSYAISTKHPHPNRVTMGYVSPNNQILDMELTNLDLPGASVQEQHQGTNSRIASQGASATAISASGHAEDFLSPHLLSSDNQASTPPVSKSNSFLDLMAEGQKRKIDDATIDIPDETSTEKVKLRSDYEFLPGQDLGPESPMVSQDITSLLDTFSLDFFTTPANGLQGGGGGARPVHNSDFARELSPNGQNNPVSNPGNPEKALGSWFGQVVESEEKNQAVPVSRKNATQGRKSPSKRHRTF